jgi:O-antigen/teichoic acid export membrane protein
MLKLLSKNAFLGDAGIYLAATIVSSAVPFLLLPFLTRWLGPAEFGLLGTFLAISTVLGAVIGLGSHGLISVVYFRDGPDAMPPQVGAAVGISGISALFWGVALYLFRDLAHSKTGIPLSWLWSVVIAGLGQFLMATLLTTFQTLKKPLWYGGVQLLYAVSLGLFTLVLIGYFGIDWTGRILAQIGSIALVVAIGLSILTRTELISWHIRRWPISRTLAFGLPLMPHVLSAIIMASVDRFALASRLGSIEVGYYFAAVQLASVLSILATALNQAWLPWLYERLERRNFDTNVLIVKMTYIIFLSFVFLGLGVSLLAPWIVPLAAGPGYEASVPLLRLLAPAAACSSGYFFVAAFLFYKERTGTLSMITVSIAALQTGLSFLLVGWWASWGVALATLISALTYWLLTWYLANQIHPMPWFQRSLQKAD